MKRTLGCNPRALAHAAVRRRALPAASTGASRFAPIAALRASPVRARAPRDYTAAMLPPRGVDLAPYVRLLLPGAPDPGGVPVVRLRPGQGFGDGRHETTQLCLLALGSIARTGAPFARVLDFGAGNGVLAVFAATRGARVDAVEIDEAALAEAGDNARDNGVADRVTLATSLPAPGDPYDVVVANILARVLLDFAEPLAARLAPAGRLVLSGLVATDVPAILARYRALLPGRRDEVYARGEWRAVVLSPR
jgi:ribosomal protein L11 methyltransferase